jgi:hypothetical protein
MKGTLHSLNSSLVAVDFMSTNLTAVLFSDCDLYRSEFEKLSPTKPILERAITIQLIPQNKTQKKFSIDGLKGLLTKYDIIVE